MKAMINRNGNAEDGRMELRLIQDGDRWRWVDENDTDSEVSAASIAEAHDAANMAWGGDNWDLITEWIACPNCNHCGSPEADKTGCGCHCANCGERL
jgi:hypothetical protein